jgi:hypothetical protein
MALMSVERSAASWVAAMAEKSAAQMVLMSVAQTADPWAAELVAAMAGM